MAFQLTREMHGVVASTSVLARSAAEVGCPEGLVIQATRQTQGYGRRGRHWHSPPGNFYGSMVLRPTQPRATWGGLSLVMALAIAETLEHYIYSVDSDGEADIAVKVKWPNDVVLVRGEDKTPNRITGKVAGVILEAIDDALIVGMGINFITAPDTHAHDSPPPHLPAMCLADAIPPHAMPSMDAFWQVLAGRLTQAYTTWQQGGLDGVREAWLSRGYCLGEAVRVRNDGTMQQGIFHGIDQGGNMLLKQNGDDDGIKVISAGDCLPIVSDGKGAHVDDKERHENYATCN